MVASILAPFPFAFILGPIISKKPASLHPVMPKLKGICEASLYTLIGLVVLIIVIAGIYLYIRRGDEKFTRGFVMWTWCAGLGLVPVMWAIHLWLCLLKGGFIGV